MTKTDVEAVRARLEAAKQRRHHHDVALEGPQAANVDRPMKPTMRTQARTSHPAHRHFGLYRHLDIEVNGRKLSVTEDDIGIVEMHER